MVEGTRGEISAVELKLHTRQCDRLRTSDDNVDVCWMESFHIQDIGTDLLALESHVLSQLPFVATLIAQIPPIWPALIRCVNHASQIRKRRGFR